VAAKDKLKTKPDEGLQKALEVVAQESAPGADPVTPAGD
jgi:hypothetical protein